MCGVAGYLSTRAPPADGASRIAAMTEALRHRGPDDGAVWVDEEARVALGYRSLQDQAG